MVLLPPSYLCLSHYRDCLHRRKPPFSTRWSLQLGTQHNQTPKPSNRAQSVPRSVLLPCRNQATTTIFQLNTIDPSTTILQTTNSVTVQSCSVKDDVMEESFSAEECFSNHNAMLTNEGLEDISLSCENEGQSQPQTAGVNSQSADYTEAAPHVFGGCMFDDKTAINGVEDLIQINFNMITAETIMRYHFLNPDVAYLFYNWYASMHGFAARKSKLMRNIHLEITQQTFLCHREGFRVPKVGETSRKRREKPITRCGCQARCVVHVESKSGRWFIKYLNDMHNHTMMNDNWSAMLPAHRKMSEYDKFQMTCMRKVGISTTNIYGFFADQAGGYENVTYMKRDMYNEQARQRQQSQFSDAKVALDFLEQLRAKDDMLFWRHTVKSDGALENLFWCDGIGRRDFSVFGDVLAFDATYRKIRYLCPLVIFSGVNHHNQSVVFASALVSNENEETYVWLLRNFVDAMGGKSPVSVITDGDLAMKNAITRVFPNAHHRLCAWHLLRNATRAVKNPKFLPRFRQCMLGDYDLGVFREKWTKLVSDFGLEDNSWIKEMYEKRSLWATSHIRGKFFAGFRTTSRCEGLHSEFSRYVNCQITLQDFMHQYFRWLGYMRYREVEADFLSAHGEPVPQTRLRFLEKSASNIYTREIFMLFHPILERALTCRVIGVKQTASCFMYTVTKYRFEDLEWRVVFTPSSLEFRCSCMRLESLGIPCEHLVTVMVYLNIVQMPETVVLKRWTKSAKDSLPVLTNNSTTLSQSALVSQYVCIVERCKRMAKAVVNCGKPELLRKTIDMVAVHTKEAEGVGSGQATPSATAEPFLDGTLRNPARVRTKGCGASASSQNKSQPTERRPRTCGVCGEQGHNRKSCHVQMDMNSAARAEAPESDGNKDFDIDYEIEVGDVDMNVG